MYDLLTVAAVVDELNEQLSGGRVQVVGLRDRSTVVFEIYSRHGRQTLVASIAGREPACYLASETLRPDPAVMTPFSLLMRKYLRGALIAAIDQPPLDRIIRMSFAKRLGTTDDVDSDDVEADEDEPETPEGIVYSSLSIELMGRRSNVVLVDNDGNVMDALKRVTPQMSGVRPVLPHRRYELPPPGTRLDPRTATSASLQGAFNELRSGEAPVAWLVRSVAGISPQMARELLFRTTGDGNPDTEALDQAATERLATELRMLFQALEQGSWQPVVYRDEHGEVAAYSALPQEHLRHSDLAENGLSSISRAVELYRGSSSVAERHAGRRDRLVRSIDSSRTKAASRLQTLLNERTELVDGDRYRRWGEAIYANLWALEPYQEVLEWEGERIPLSPGKPANELAQEYFTRYRKAGRGRDQLETLITSAENEVAYLDQLVAMASMAESFEEIESVRREWESQPQSASGRDRQPAKRQKTTIPKPVYDARGNAIYVGRSGQANDAITFTVSGPDDFWLHARGVPGAHVVLRPQPGSTPTDQEFEQAASMAAYYSTARENGMVEVDICRRRDVRKIKGAGPGMVTYRNERTVRVPPRAALPGS